jgi:hypothetical protein
MKRLESVEEMYSLVEELISELKGGRFSRMSEILYHRMHKVSWTSSAELLEELQNELTKFLQTDAGEISEEVREQIEEAVRFAKSHIIIQRLKEER